MWFLTSTISHVISCSQPIRRAESCIHFTIFNNKWINLILNYIYIIRIILWSYTSLESRRSLMKMADGKLNLIDANNWNRFYVYMNLKSEIFIESNFFHVTSQMHIFWFMFLWFFTFCEVCFNLYNIVLHASIHHKIDEKFSQVSYTSNSLESLCIIPFRCCGCQPGSIDLILKARHVANFLTNLSLFLSPSFDRYRSLSSVLDRI